MSLLLLDHLVEYWPKEAVEVVGIEAHEANGHVLERVMQLVAKVRLVAVLVGHPAVDGRLPVQIPAVVVDGDGAGRLVRHDMPLSVMYAEIKCFSGVMYGFSPRNIVELTAQHEESVVVLDKLGERLRVLGIEGRYHSLAQNPQSVRVFVLVARANRERVGDVQRLEAHRIAGVVVVR